MALRPGQRLAQYRLVEQIGAGGMGVVWKARDESLDRDVAIKVLADGSTLDADRLARFEREAKAVAALSHPNIVSIYGYGTDEGIAYAAIELLAGRTLREHLEGGPLPPRKALDIARQIAAGLDAAHAKGIVHRDLKPDNVFITPDGRPRILDFGLAGNTAANSAALQSEIETREHLTKPGVVMGTVAYMSPEQARGQKAGTRSDIFALGTILHEMLTGERPFRRETAAETMTAILRKDPPDLVLGGQAASSTLGRIIRRCLEKAPEERFQNARDLGFALEDAALDSGTSLTAVSALEDKATGRLRWGLPALLITIAVFTFAAGWLLRPVPPATTPPRVKQLTFSGSDHQPTVSPDGRLIAFTSSRNGVSQIWLRQVNGGGEQPLTDGVDWRPRFSPDGTSVTFIHHDGEQYSAYRIPVVGGQSRKLMEDVIEVEWSPDGRQLAFLRGTDRDAEIAGTALGVFDLQSGEEKILVQFATWDFLGLRWSPDGTRIVTSKTSFHSGAGNWRILLVTPDGNSTEEIAPEDGALISAPTWAGPDALIYAKASSTVPASPSPNSIVRYDLGTREERLLLWEPYLFPSRMTLTESTRINLLGEDRLVFDTHQQTQTLHEIEPSVGISRSLIEAASTDRQPVYSPDGGKVLFTSNRTGNVDLFAYEFAARRLLQLTDHVASDWDGAYTPDGGSILWSSDRGGHLEIWMAEADGSNPRQITQDGVDAENPTMTADGQWIVYASGHPDHPGIFKIRPDGSDQVHLLPGKWVNPEVSPDGRYAMCVSTGGGQMENQIRVLDLETSEVIDFTISISYDPQAPSITYGRGRWMPDGSALAFIGIDEYGKAGIWIQDFAPGRDTSASRRALVEPGGDMIVESFGISPDGSRFALATIRQKPAIKEADGLPLLR